MQRCAVLGIALATALAALSAACASGGGPRPRPFPTPPDRPGSVPAPEVPPAAGAAGADGLSIASTALRLQGVPYRYGGTDLTGFDCSGLVQYVFLQHGIGLPRVVREQFEFGAEIAEDRLRPGDLVFFVTEGRDVSHVGIAIGGGQFVHAPNERGVVRVDSLSSDYWGGRLAGARRIVDTRMTNDD